ncbi:DMT family transporter [Sinorhizobium fredii]|uniref:DMT family transporter n=1 Tax=Rhizobium fredii TaxID=380 RepID=UPI00351488BC
MSDAVATVSYRPRSGISAVVMLIILEGALVISWSAGFVGIRFAIDHAPIFLILLWRSLVSGLLLLPFALIMGPAIRWKDAFAQIVFGALAMSGYLAGFALAISYGVPTGLVALIADMLPLAVAILSWPVLGQVLTGRQWFGSGLGMAGVLIASGWSLNMGSVPLWAYGLPVLGTLSLAMATLLQKRSPSKSMPVYQSLCIQCLSAAAIFAVFAWYEGGFFRFLTKALSAASCGSSS